MMTSAAKSIHAVPMTLGRQPDLVKLFDRVSLILDTSTMHERPAQIYSPHDLDLLIANPGGIMGPTHFGDYQVHPFGTHVARLPFGSSITVVGRHNNEVLVTYAGTQHSYSPPDGSLFLLPVRTYNELAQAYKKVENEARSERTLINGLLNRGKSIDCPPLQHNLSIKFVWTIESLKSGDTPEPYKYEALAGGQIQGLRRSNARMLVSYTPPIERDATHTALAGSLFFIPVPHHK
jgi:hypothetical protein